MKKRILFVINTLNCGGAEKSLISLLSVFDYDRYDVELQMISICGSLIEFVPPQVKVLPAIRYFDYCTSSFFSNDVTFAFALARLKISLGIRTDKKLYDVQVQWKYASPVIKPGEEEYDVAIAWGQDTPTHYVAEKVKARKKLAFINGDYRKAGRNRDFDAPFYMKYDYVVSVSDLLSDIIIEVFPEIKDRVRTVYDINNAELIISMAELENPFSDVHGKIKIVTVGRLAKTKGYDIAVEAAKTLRDKGVSFVWYFVGGGPEMTAIKESVKANGLESIVFPVGEKENPYAYMKNADIYVQTSRREGYCLTLYEARVLNKPCVSTCFDVVYNQLIDGENGIITEMNGEAVAMGILKLIKSDELRNHIIENVKKEKKGNVEEIEKLYELIEK